MTELEDVTLSVPQALARVASPWVMQSPCVGMEYRTSSSDHVRRYLEHGHDPSIKWRLKEQEKAQRASEQAPFPLLVLFAVRFNNVGQGVRGITDDSHLVGFYCWSTVPTRVTDI